MDANSTPTFSIRAQFFYSIFFSDISEAKVSGVEASHLPQKERRSRSVSEADIFAIPPPSNFFLPPPPPSPLSPDSIT